MEQVKHHYLDLDHTHFVHCHFFETGEISHVHRSCLAHSSAEACEDLAVRTAKDAEPCPHARHIRTASKTARDLERESNKVFWQADAGLIEERDEELMREVTVYETLCDLQGSVIPYYFGKWEHPDAVYYVYEYVGDRVSQAEPNVRIKKRIANSARDAQPRQMWLTNEDKRSIKAQARQLLAQLHRAGYVHDELYGDDLLVSHVADMQGNTHLQCRLVGLTSAVELRRLSLSERADLIERDLHYLDTPRPLDFSHTDRGTNTQSE